MPEQPLVSVVTPVYNGADFLADCIQSVLAQTFTNYEYIIVNNCSTDRTLEIALAYAQKDSRIQVRTNKTFVGVIENHNIAFSLISQQAKYCKVVSADDFIFEDCLARLVECADAYPSAGIIGSYQLTGRYIRWQGFEYPKSVLPGSDVCRRLFMGDQAFLEGLPIIGFGTPTSLLYRAGLVRASGAFYPNPSPHADTSACFKSLRTCDFGFVYQVLSYERTHSATQSSKSIAMNRYLSACLDDLIQYGPFYLTKEELEHRIHETLASYHRYLVISYVLGPGGKEFWNYHKDRLSELGYPLTRGQLLKAGLIALLQAVLNPGNAITKVRKRAGPRAG